MARKKLFRSDFKDDGNGVLTKSYHIVPVNDNEVVEKIQEDTQAYNSSNENVATAAAHDDDKNHFDITWVGAGDVDINASADADLSDGVKTVSGVLELTLAEDEATKIEFAED